VYANAAFHRVMSYQGARPFTGEAATPVPAPSGKHPWSFWTGTEGWAALLDESNHGLGLITPVLTQTLSKEGSARIRDRICHYSIPSEAGAVSR
jgi:hypothetical protein